MAAPPCQHAPRAALADGQDRHGQVLGSHKLHLKPVCLLQRSHDECHHFGSKQATGCRGLSCMLMWRFLTKAHAQGALEGFSCSPFYGMPNVRIPAQQR